MRIPAIGVFVVALTVAMLAFGGGATTAYAEEGACGNDALDVPDAGATFDFTIACENHDDCYAAGGTETDREACDSAFLAEMRASCAAMWPGQPFKRFACNTVATTYYLGVRIAGWAFFPYT